MIDLVGVAEIAQRLGTTVNTVHSWRSRHESFPGPVAILAMGPVWDWVDVAAWAAIPRKPGRPKRRAPNG